MRTAFAVLLLVLLGPGSSTLEALPFAEMAPGNARVPEVLSGRTHFTHIRIPNSPAAFWIRLRLRKAAASPNSWVIFLPRSVDYAVAYLPAAKGYRVQTAGTSVPFAQYRRPYLAPAFMLDQDSFTHGPIYIRVHYFPDSPFYIRVMTTHDAVTMGMQTRLVQGLFLGVLLAIALCNLYVVLVVRDRSAAFFVLYIAALAINELVATGMGSQYLWPNAAPDARAFTLLTNTLAFLTGLLFTRSFLQTRTAAPAWDRMLIGWFIAEASIDTLRHALPHGMVLAPLLLAVQLAGMLITVAAGVVRVRQGFAPARFFVVAFAPALAGYMANLAYDIYTPPGNWFFASNGVEFGAMFESIIFSFSLLDRIRILDAANVRLRTLATSDPLTGLCNRTAFFDRFDHEIEAAKQSKSGLGVLYVDLDGFKAINDRFGHRIGDLLLQVVARRLQAAVRDSDTVARLGGDEFAVLLTAVSSQDVLDAVLADVMRVADSPLTIEGNLVHVGASIGAALYPRDGDEPDRLMEAADRAMYAAKQAQTQAPAERESTTPA